MGIDSYSTTPADNNAAPPNGWPEGMAPSDVNNCARQMMADIRSWYQDAQWTDLGDTPTYVSTSSFTISGDVTASYVVGRRVRLDDSGTLYGTITGSSYSVPDTTITLSLDSGALSVALSAVALSILTPTSSGLPGTIYLADGAVGSPSLSNIGDTNTGLYFPAADQVAAACAGAQVILLSATGLSVTGAASASTTVSAGTQFLGAAASSAYSFTGDTNNSWGSPTADEQAWTTGGTERARLKNSYKLGLGTTTPDNAGSFGAALEVNAPSGNAGYNLSLAGTLKAQFGAISSDVFLGTVTNQDLRFLTNNTNRARITGAGRFLIGVTSPINVTTGTTAGVDIGVATGVIQASASAAEALDLQRSTSNGKCAIFWRDTTEVGSISITTTTTTYNTSSDVRLKRAIEDITDSGSVIDAISPKKWIWDHAEGDLPGIGFIAQELVSVVPSAVFVGDDDPDKRPGDEGFSQWGVDASKIMPYVIAELKSLRSRVAQLEGA